MATEEDNSRHTQPPACTAKEAFKFTAMCISCVCACRNTKQKSRKNEAEYVEGRTKCTAEVHDRNKEKKTAQAHDIALRKKQRPFIKKINENKKKTHPHPSTPSHFGKMKKERRK
ncbi:hypothetical protein TCDM_10872 [Trypanosoma cruzi Dm28c]|uniref:Uncharacterized protein n=1 Tax=Trypanosoma cruzi Dm28c TaxID=1416333 RepID=V5B6E1_TRYCR|nr:hypothetical protein TCDM_10872 [Trypanosoma cruzi Dm28c]